MSRGSEHQRHDAKLRGVASPSARRRVVCHRDDLCAAAIERVSQSERGPAAALTRAKRANVTAALSERSEQINTVRSFSVVGGRGWDRLRARGRSVQSGLTVVAVAALLAALGAAIWFGIGWGRAQFSERPAAHARAEMLDAAREAAVNLSSFDIADLDTSFAKIDGVVAGQLAADLAANRPMLKQLLIERQANSTATVEESAVVDLDRKSWTASAIVVMRQVTAVPDAPEQTARVTTLVTMQKVGDRWLATQAQPLGNAPLDERGN